MNPTIKSEALWALCNAINTEANAKPQSMSIAERLLAIDNAKIVLRLANGLKMPDERLIAELLQALTRLIDNDLAFERLENSSFEDFLSGYVKG
jgi:hypothetical protein